MMSGMEIQEPDWFTVVGGPPPGEVVLRDLLAGLLVLMATMLLVLALPLSMRTPGLLVAAMLAVGTYLALRQLWRRGQQVRIFGNILEHRDGQRMVRVALNRAVLSTASAPPGMLVLMLDDGRGHVTLARRADPRELSDLPPCMGSYLELRPDDFEEVRMAAHRSYPQA
jgi:hypothetical protein